MTPTGTRWNVGATWTAAFGFALLLGFRAWPLVLDPGSAVVDPTAIGSRGAIWARADVDLLMWIVSWTARASLVEPLSMFQGNIFHPAPDSLASSEHLLGLLPVTIPLWWTTGNAVLTYNITTLVIVWIAAFSTYLLVFDWTSRPSAAFLAGSLFALGADVPLSFLRLHTSAIHLYPLVLLLAWRVAERPRPAWVLALSLVAALQALAGVYVAFGLGALCAAALPSLIATARRHGHSGLAPAGGLILGALPLALVAPPYLRIRAAGVLPDATAAHDVVAAATSDFTTLVSRLAAELTWVGLVLAALGAFWPRAPRGTRGCLLAVAGVGFVLALGTQTPIYTGLMTILPGFSGMRAPTRFLYLPLLAVAVLAGMGAAALLERTHERLGRRGTRPAQALVIALAVVLVPLRATPWPLPLAPDPLAGIYVGSHRWLAANAPPGPVLDLPVPASAMQGREMLATGRAMLGSTLHWFPLLNGYSGHAPGGHGEAMALARKLPEAEALAALCSRTGLRWLVVHHGLMPEGSAARWRRAETTLPLSVARRHGRDTIYEVRCDG